MKRHLPVLALWALVLVALVSPATPKPHPEPTGIIWCPLGPIFGCYDVWWPAKPKPIQPIKCHEETKRQ